MSLPDIVDRESRLLERHRNRVVREFVTIFGVNRFARSEVNGDLCERHAGNHSDRSRRLAPYSADTRCFG